MKVLKEIIWLTPDLSGLGGSEYLVTSFCRLLSACGIHVHLVTNALHPSWKTAFAKNEGTGKIHIREVCSGEATDFADAIESIVQCGTISLMQVMPLETFSFEIIRFKAYDFPVCGLEPTDLSNKCWWLPDDLTQLIHQLDGLLVLNPDAAAVAADRYAFTGPIKIISNTLMNDLYRKGIRQYAATDFGCISRLSAEKGLEYLLGAFSLLSARFPAASLGIWGEGEDRERLINQAKMLDIVDRVHFHGAFHPFDDSLAISGSAEIFVLPSLFEGCPVSLLEMAGRGKPLISTATSGGKWLLGEDYPGLVPIADTGSLAHMMARALTEQPLRAELSRHAQERVDTLFCAAVTQQQLISFYTTIVTLYANRQLNN